MSAAETIAKAIEKLEDLRSDAGHDWRMYRPLHAGGGGGYAVNRWEDVSGWYGNPEGTQAPTQVVADHMFREHADLIVTLHRTIDAQLAILRHVATYYAGDLGVSTNRHVVALAEAILGGEQ